MTVSQTFFTAENRKQRLLREALVDVQALVPVVGRVGGARPAAPNIYPCRPITPNRESTMQANRDSEEGKLYWVIGTLVAAAVLFGVVASLIRAGTQGPAFPASAQPVTLAIHGIPAASTVFDATAPIETLPPTF